MQDLAQKVSEARTAALPSRLQADSPLLSQLRAASFFAAGKMVLKLCFGSCSQSTKYVPKMLRPLRAVLETDNDTFQLEDCT